MWGIVFLIVSIIVIIIATYYVIRNIINNIVDTGGNKDYCKEHKDAPPCVNIDYSKYTTLEYKNKKQSLINLGNLYVNTQELDSIPSGYTILSTYHMSHWSNPIAHLFIDDSKSKLFIVIRGTDTNHKLEKTLDSEYKQIKYPYVKSTDIYVSYGFNKAYSYFRDKLLADINKYKDINDIYVVGHSLGAAVCGLLTADYIENTNKNIHTFAIAPPRVGDGRLSNFIKNSKSSIWYTSIINLSDLVPAVPLPLIYSLYKNRIYYYTHIGDDIILFDKNYGSVGLNHNPNLYIYELIMSTFTQG